MSDLNHYSKLTLEELLKKEREAKQLQTLFVVLAVGITAATLYAIATGHIRFLHSVTILFSLFLLMRNGTTLKQLQAEIKNRTAP